MSGRIEVQRVHSFDESFPEEARGFVERFATTFDQSLPWFVEFERHLVPATDHMQILVAVDVATRRTVGVLPLQTVPVSIVGPITASSISALSNYYTAFYAPMIESGREVEVALHFAREVVELGRSSVVDLNPVSDSVVWNEMEVEWRRLGFRTERYFRFGNWIHEVKGETSSQYLARLPGKVRSTLKRKGAKFRAIDGSAIRIVTDESEVSAAMDAYEQVYRSSWKADEPHKDFIRAIALEFARRGWLRLGLAEIDSQPVAAQIWFVYQGTASIFKLAYDGAFGDLSVGSLLTERLMQQAIDADGVSVIDYLCGDDAYKRDWMSSRRERIGIRAFRRMSWPGLLAEAVEIAKGLGGAAARSARVESSRS